MTSQLLSTDALGDGWRLIQASPLSTRAADDVFATGVLEYEWLFERVVARPEAHGP